MSPDERWFPSHLREMTEAECVEQLAGNRVGRVAYSDERGPVVLPVNYTWGLGTVLFQTSPESTLAKHMVGAQVSFEIDDHDEYNQSGWSVLVRGESTSVGEGGLTHTERRAIAWPEGRRVLHIRITPHEITGRWLMPG
jgi:nitroimidazol reductase NimA-like FMN-containing flavoprotein (pyridoxamine 5'-phosphate oxidase superfamily)